jgi:hypothetical protein
VVAAAQLEESLDRLGCSSSSITSIVRHKASDLRRSAVHALVLYSCKEHTRRAMRRHGLGSPARRRFGVTAEAGEAGAAATTQDRGSMRMEDSLRIFGRCEKFLRTVLGWATPLSYNGGTS